jgi:hypothetical protein
MYRRVAFAAVTLSLAVGGMLMVWALLRPHADVQRLYGVFLALAGLLVGGVLLVGAMSIPASAGQVSWRRLRPRWPVVMGVVVIASVCAPDVPHWSTPALPLAQRLGLRTWGWPCR